MKVFDKAKLKQLMAERGLDSRKLAQLMVEHSGYQISFETINSWLKSTADPRSAYLALLAEVFNCTMEDLMVDVPVDQVRIRRKRCSHE